MTTEQLQLLMPEGEIELISIKGTPFFYAMYEGVIDGRDVFSLQGRRHEGPSILSWKCRRSDLHYDRNSRSSTLNDPLLEVYTPDHPNFEKTLQKLTSRGFWDENRWRRQ